MKLPATLPRVLLLAVIVLPISPAAANPIYKCTNSAGHVTYSAMPCYGEQWKRMGAPEAPPRKRESASPPAQAATKPSPATPSPAKPVKAPAPQ